MNNLTFALALCFIRLCIYLCEEQNIIVGSKQIMSKW